MKIDKHISALLYDHDCIIVPDFGGFVSSYAPAKVHPTQHIFHPPHKNITFNKHLKSNDGLLASQISRSENKTFTEANSILASFVSESTSAFKRGEKITLECIGSLYMDVERNIQFEPDHSTNYLTEAYGMTSLQSLPVKREGLQDRIEKGFIDRKAIPQKKGKMKVYSRAGAIFTILVIALAGSIIFLSTRTGVLKEISYSSLNPFVEKTKIVSSVKDHVPPKPPANDSVHKAITPPPGEVVIKNHEPDKTAVSVNGVKTAKKYKYHIVSGCFKIKSNALNFLAKMKSKNFNATILGQNKDGLYVISCGDYAQKEEAYTELARVRSQNMEAWMLAE